MMSKLRVGLEQRMAAAPPKDVLRTAPEAFEPLSLVGVPDTVGEVLEAVAVTRQLQRRTQKQR